MNGIGQAVGAIVLAALIASGVMGEPVVTRTPRGNTSETGAVTRTTRGKTTQASPSGIVTGEWEFEGDSMLDVLYVTIDIDYGYASVNIENADPNELAAEVGMTYIGESVSPQGCRALTFSGPLGMPVFVFMCAVDGFYMYGVTTDKSASDYVIEQFVSGEPFSPPYGWYPAS